MRSCEELTAEVFRRIEAQTAERKRKRRTIVKCTSAACCFFLVALIGVGVWQTASQGALPDVPQAQPPVVSGQPSEESEQPSSEPAEDHVERNALLYDSVFSGHNGALEETVQDMHRPEGYNSRIGTILALKLSLHTEEPDYLYHVVLESYPDYEQWNPEAILSRVSPQTKETLAHWVILRDDLVEAVMECTGQSEQEAIDTLKRLGLHTPTIFYYVFTAEEIKELAEAGFICYYVASGEGTVTDMDWENAEDVEAFCELHGDLEYTAAEGAPKPGDYWHIIVSDGEVVAVEGVLE